MRWNFIDDYDERYFLDYDLAKLVLDQFYLKINSNLSNSTDFFLYTRKTECVDCPYLAAYYGKDKANSCEKSSATNIFSTNLGFRIATTYKEYFPENEINSVICDISPNFGQFGVYSIDVDDKGCSVNTLKEPVNIYTPIVTVFVIYAAIFSIITGIVLAWKKTRFAKPSKTVDEVNKKERVRSLDTFRGIAIVIMMFANFGSGAYEIIEHAKWNGLHIADLVFPWFMWIMGVCIPITVTSSFKKNVPNKTMMTKVFIRSIKLFILGIFLVGGTDLSYLRIFGVLQRFGIAYLVVTTICIFLMDTTTDESTSPILRQFDDVLKIVKGWGVVLTLLIVHTLLIFLISAPDCPRGYMGPGGLHKNQAYTKCVGGATGYIDGLILGNHRYQRPTIYSVFEAKPFDPEGVVGCLTSIFQVFLGVQAGVTLLVYKSHSQRLIRWLTWSVVTGIIGGSLCGFSKEDGVIPVNKNLWSLSFVMVTSCFAFALLALCYFLVDLKKWWSGKPFLFAGMNSILMYIGHEMTGGNFPVRWSVHNYVMETGERRTHFIAFFSDTWGTAVWVLVSYYLYQIDYFFTI